MSNLSAGVQILVDQLRENPDAFFGPLSHDPREGYISPRFSIWRQTIEEEIIGVEPLKDRVRRVLPAVWFLSEDEKEALADAYLQAKRQRFDAEIIFALNRPEVESDTMTIKAHGRYATTLASNTVSATAITGIIGAYGQENTNGR